MASFKLKLVTYFTLVALVPVIGAYYGFATLAKRHETQRIDNRLRADVRAAIAGYAQQLDAAERRALPVPLTDAVARLHSAIDPNDMLLASQGGVVITGPFAGNMLPLAPGEAARVKLDGHEYRGLATSTLAAGGDVQFASLVPQEELDTAIGAQRWRLIAILALAIAICGGLVYGLGVSIVRTLGRLSRGADEIARG